jgi:multiple sugar transport system substrate-binding protein
MADRSFPGSQTDLSRRKLIGTGAKLTAGAVGAASLTFSAPAIVGAQDKIKISMMGWGSPLEKENVETGLTAFEQANPDIEVEWIHVPDDYPTKLKTALAGGSPPDVFWDNNPADYSSRGLLLDITDYLAADPVLGAPDYFLQPMENDREDYNGRWYGIGSCWVVPHIYYNADILSGAGIEPPGYDTTKAWTWDQFLDISRQLTLDGGGKHPGEDGFNVEDVQQWGVSWPTGNGIVRNTVNYTNLAEVYTKDFQFKLGEPAGVESLQALADLTNVHQVAPQASMFEQLGMDAWQALASGRVAIIIDGSWALQDIAKLGFNFGCGVLPYMKEPWSGATAHSHVIHKDTKNPDAAWKLLAYLSSDDYQRGLCAAGLWLPSHTSLMTPEGLATWITEGVHPEGYSAIATDYLLNHTKAEILIPGISETNTLLTTALDPVWIGQSSVEDALNGSGTAEQINGILQETKANLAGG